MAPVTGDFVRALPSKLPSPLSYTRETLLNLHSATSSKINSTLEKLLTQLETTASELLLKLRIAPGPDQRGPPYSRRPVVCYHAEALGDTAHSDQHLSRADDHKKVTVETSRCPRAITVKPCWWPSTAAGSEASTTDLGNRAQGSAGAEASATVTRFTDLFQPGARPSRIKCWLRGLTQSTARAPGSWKWQQSLPCHLAPPGAPDDTTCRSIPMGCIHQPQRADNTLHRWKLGKMHYLPRKHGKRAGLLVRLKLRGFRVPMPTILPANVQTIQNKVDDLKGRLTYCREMQNCCVFCFTETWL
ncbi:uncharacterized protein LOC134339320 [Mobula hypostoma]|uniref:uncharacterized protein LOC134339320 n=1 Tax=Mobula hypostoma TaxID=723540 RepID=UPI002FC39A0B